MTTTNQTLHWNAIRFFSTSPVENLIEDENYIGSVEGEDENDAIVSGQEPPTLRRFEDLDLHPKSLKALRHNGLHNLTEIQEKTFDVILTGKDVVGRARTGTGKTLGFLLPALERIVRQDPPLPGIQLLILSPTRELAAQIAQEAERLVASHDNSITSQVVFGGAPKREDIERFERQLPTILVATPGRLKDHLASTFLNVGGKKIPFIDAVQQLQVLVMDETDRLLDLGFRQDIQDILSCLPKKKRQTLLFSATLPANVKDVVSMATKQDYQLVDCIQDEDPASHTNAKTEQSHIVLPAERFWTGSMQVLMELMNEAKDKNNNNKVIVFFPMTSMVELYAQIFNLRFGRRVWELHGKMHQRERSTISTRFRNAPKGVLFTSDVSARGVDYPNVTHVIQIGAAGDRETYIHRLGRTGRAGKRGKGLLILPEVEKSFLHDLEGLEMPLDADLQRRLSSETPPKLITDELGPVAQDVRSGKDRKITKTVQSAYQAMIGYYFQRCHKKDSHLVVSTINSLAIDVGLKELPAIDYNRARKIGVDQVPGLNIKQSWNDRGGTDGWAGDSKKQQKPFGQHYGDFDGKFGSSDNRREESSRPDRRNSGREGSDSVREDRGRYGKGRGGNRREGSDSSREDRGRQSPRGPMRSRSLDDSSGTGRQGGRQASEQFLKLGPKARRGTDDEPGKSKRSAWQKDNDFTRYL
jgi:ATP-dependent RNA helicase MSS116